jgi:hypothetical protein
MEKIKDKKIFKIIFGVFRGLLRTNPAGNAVIDIVENVTAVIKKKNDAGQKIELPHSWSAIIVEVVGVACIIYAFNSGIISVEQVKAIVNLLLENI